MEEKKRGRGRPKIDVDLDEVEELAEEGNSAEHIASVLGFSKTTLFVRKDVRAAYDRGRAKLCVDLRHWQILAAKSGNVQMLIWLGRQYLDQKERAEQSDKEVMDKLDAVLKEIKGAE